MADIIDKANERANEIFEEQLYDSRKPEGPVATGRCHNCDEHIPYPNRWCDSDCRDDWEARNNA